jgi:hypothetical protein
VARGGGPYFLDGLLSRGRRINALACDDAHFVVEGDENRDAFGGWVMVKSERNEPETLLPAVKAGHYYSTQRLTIECITVEGGGVTVECSSAIQIILLGRAAR